VRLEHFSEYPFAPETISVVILVVIPVWAVIRIVFLKAGIYKWIS
jgi:hypothetical protein